MTKTRKVDVRITHPDKGVVFEKLGFEVPADWSDRAATIVASKYAMDDEYSALNIIDRVVTQIVTWGQDQRYFNSHRQVIVEDLPSKPLVNIEDPEWNHRKFQDSLKEILVNQRAAFNSPVWFNVGADTGSNQCSGCFILPLEDDMDSILNHTVIEGKIFKGGSGAGVNVSKLRAQGEKLSNKGNASGPISFMRGWDSFAGVIKSGGKVRRSAKLVCMDTDHPDIMEFIECKKKEEDKAKILIDAGVPPEEAYATVDFQNTNHSIRVTNNFMKSVVADGEWALTNRRDHSIAQKIPAKDILRRAAEVAWATGDPGIQFDDRMNIDNPVPGLGEIRSTNPCSEFSAIDNSSCNLASVNLVKYFDISKKDMFDWDAFKEDIKIIITAMDILIEAADYPTSAIRETTILTRPLGLGFANLGALLILMGLPYDSDKGRAVAALISKEMTKTAYQQSIKLADKLGSFEGIGRGNQIECANVAKRLTHDDKISSDVLYKGLRNSQLTLLAPTGTISFMMDCDTTGIEPLFALECTKSLAGGGQLEILAQCVRSRLEQMGFMKEGEEYVDGLRRLPKEDKEIFKTANEISWKAHIDMMAACQPYLNGAISKTINMPSDATVDNVEEAYIYAWQKGLKSLAIYRDGSKQLQPLIDKNKSEPEPKLIVHEADDDEEEWTAYRRSLPNDRQSVTHKFNVSGFEGYLISGLYEDGTLGEIFIRTQKQGSTMQGVLDAFATAVSLALQYGVPLETLIDKFEGNMFPPGGITTNEDIRYAHSIVDYIFRYLQINFIEDEDELEEETPPARPSQPPALYDGPPCPKCGAVTGRSGTCYLCPTCGETTGCS